MRMRSVLAPVFVVASLVAAAAVGPAGSFSASDVWAFPAGHWLHWSARHWTAGSLPAVARSVSENITSTAVISPTDVWAVGDLIEASDTPYIGHFNGRRWRGRATAPGR